MYCLLLCVLLITPMLRLVIICLISCSIYPNPCFRWAKTSLTFKLLQQISLHKNYGTTTQLKSFENDWPSNCRINKLQVSWLILCYGKFREKSSRYVILVYVQLVKDDILNLYNLFSSLLHYNPLHLHSNSISSILLLCFPTYLHD